MKTLTVSAVALVALALSAPGLASTLTCPESLDEGQNRTVTIDPERDWSCGVSGAFAGNVPDATFSPKLEELNANATGEYMTISGIDGTSGTFVIAGGLEDVVLVFKFGANEQPDFISFYWDERAVDSGGVLTEGGTTGLGVTGTWSVAINGEEKGDLSNVRLYGVKGDDFVPPEQVPEPATLMLLGMGLLGLAVLRRRRMI